MSDFDTLRTFVSEAMARPPVDVRKYRVFCARCRRARGALARYIACSAVFAPVLPMDHALRHADPRDTAAGRLVPFHASSPLWLVTNEPEVNDLVNYLDAMRRQIEASPAERHV